MNSEHKQLKRVLQSTHSLLQKMRIPITSRVLTHLMNTSHSKQVDGICEWNVTVKMVIPSSLSNSSTMQRQIHTLLQMLWMIRDSWKKMAKCSQIMMLTWLLGELGLKEWSWWLCLLLAQIHYHYHNHNQLHHQITWMVEYSKYRIGMMIHSSTNHLA